MFLRLLPTGKWLVLTTVLVFPLILGVADNSIAGNVHKGRNKGPVVIKRLPAGYKPLSLGRQQFYLHKGIFYRRGTGGYISVSAPIGAFISVLPVGYSTVVVRGTTYYVSSGIYYRPSSTGYVIVEPPGPDVVITQEQVVVNTRLLNVRLGPGIEHSVVTRVRQGDVLTVEGSSSKWFYIRTSNGKSGWVMRKFTQSLLQHPQG